VQAGGRAVTLDEYRTAFTRPVSRFYERVLGRPVSDDDWLAINETFHATYRTQMATACLAPDARDALHLVARRGITQSLLSMWTHDELVPMVESFGIDHHFVRIDGQLTASGGNKHEFLKRHLEHLAVPPTHAEDVLLIGDSTDDAAAALDVGVRCVLVASGTHHEDDLANTGVPVAGSLIDALDLGGVDRD
jgi:phosphoglycolate phosphatase-like HAD superfamily hydrolase